GFFYNNPTPIELPVSLLIGFSSTPKGMPLANNRTPIVFFFK
ncbi:unnamed protein product, partial [marine sediment metagenome]